MDAIAINFNQPRNAAHFGFYAVAVSRAALTLLMLALMLLAPAARARSFQSECEARLEHADVTVRMVAVSYGISQALSIDDLMRKAPPPPGEEKILGLTIARQGSNIEYTQSGLHEPTTHEYCMRPRFLVTLSYNPVEVYVGREIPAGSCGYEEVLRHEERHVDAYRQQLGRAVEGVRQALLAAYGDTIFYGDAERLARELKDATERKWLPLAQRELDAVAKVHQHIDSPEEYQRYRATCHGELNRILQNLHR